MSESFEQLPISEEVVIEALNTRGVEDPEAKELLDKYVNRCQTEAKAEVAADPESPVVSNRAPIKAAIKIAILYSKTERYRDYGRESLQEVLLVASQDDSTQDLVQEIEHLLSEL